MEARSGRGLERSLAKGGTTTPRFAVYDNIVIGSPASFDVYIFDDTGTKQVTDFIWEFQGI